MADQLMSDDDYSALTEVLIAACPEPARQWLKDMLSHGNGRSLRVRVAQLVSKAGSVGTTLASTFKNYPARLRDCRDQYAHWQAGKLSSERVIEVAALFDATKIILETCLLQDLGWSLTDAATALAAQRDFESLSGRPRRQIVT